MTAAGRPLVCVRLGNRRPKNPALCGTPTDKPPSGDYIVARKSKINATDAAVSADTVLSTNGFAIDNTTLVSLSPSELMTFSVATEDADVPVNVGRDGDHTEAKIAARAVSMRVAQTTPLLFCDYEGQNVIVDGAGRLASAKMIVAGFDFGGRSYAEVADYKLLCFRLTRPDGSVPTADQVITTARYLNANKNNDGIVGPISMARTADRLRATGKKGKALEAAMVECGMPADASKLSRLAAAVKLPLNMQSVMLLNDMFPTRGIGFSVLYKHLAKDDVTGKVAYPTEEQFDALTAKATYAVTEKKNGVDVIEHLTDYRGVIIDAWYLAGFDVTCPAFANWKPNGKTVPVVPKTADEKLIVADRNDFKWSVLKTKINDAAGPALVTYAMRTAFAIIDSVAYVQSPAEGATNRKASEAVAALQALLCGLSDGTLAAGE